MLWSNFFITTSKETPKDATAASHRLMLRTGMVRQLSAGAYSYLPLGFRSLRKVEKIVREEMNRAGAIELMMPVLHPIDLWHETGRVEAMGDVLLRLGGPEGDWRTQTVLGPTHEEVITEIARAYLNSYKQLPVSMYQIQVKFRGEARPKSGVLRTREFLMKDAYSFHDTVESLDAVYQKMYDAYCRIFARCGLPYVAVEAESGPIGGDASHEFMVLTDAGEDVVALTDNQDYAANTERAVCAPLPQDDAAMADIAEIETPNQRTIDEVCAFLKSEPRQMIKTLVYTLAYGTDKKRATKTVVALVRGDHEVNENKLDRAAIALLAKTLGDETSSPKPQAPSLDLADEATIKALTGADVGFAGPHSLTGDYLLVVDQAVSVMRNGVTGANKTGYHVQNLNPGRDFAIEGETVSVADIRNVTDGDQSPKGSGAAIRLRKSIEVGHVFKLGTKYSESMKATYLDKNGKAKPLIMGCYGIGLNRIMASAIEAHHDDGGIIWPMSIAPFQVLILALDPKEEDVMNTARALHDELEAAGIDVLLDDRDERAGFKFKDADLIGIPVRVTIGRKGLADGVVELKRRAGDEIDKIAPGTAAARVKEMVKGELQRLDAGK